MAKESRRGMMIAGTTEAINTEHGLELVRERETYHNGW